MCKRSHAAFAEPLPPFQHEDHPSGVVVTPRHTQKTKVPLIGDFLALGADLPSKLCNLTNEIHPIFQHFHVCQEHAPDVCEVVDFSDKASRDQSVMEALKIASPDPEINFVVRAMMQLATRIITHDDTLPFWWGILQCEYSPDMEFKAPPRRHLNPAQKEQTLQHLLEFAGRVRFHFRDFTKSPELAHFGQTSAFTARVDIEDSDLPPFVHITLAVNSIDGYDQQADSYKQYTFGQLTKGIVYGAATICHELAHGLVEYKLQPGPGDGPSLTGGRAGAPRFNGELAIENGFSLENFLFGGVLKYWPEGMFVSVWPDKTICEEYSDTGRALGLSNLDNLPTQRFWFVPEVSYRCLLKDSFWAEKGVRKGRFKKMWMRPYHQVPMSRKEYDVFATGYETRPASGGKKKRNKVVGLFHSFWNRQMSAPAASSTRVRWSRCKEKLEVRKEDFHEREIQYLNQAWVDLLVPISGHVFLQGRVLAERVFDDSMTVITAGVANISLSTASHQ